MTYNHTLEFEVNRSIVTARKWHVEILFDRAEKCRFTIYIDDKEQERACIVRKWDVLNRSSSDLGFGRADEVTIGRKSYLCLLGKSTN